MTSTGASITRAPEHEHAWELISSHATSQGLILYVRCCVCDGLRVDLLPDEAAVPRDVSHVVDVGYWAESSRWSTS